MHATLPLLEASDFPPIRRRKTETLQVNLGYRCNQSCLHCHVNAGPTRTEEMSRETLDDVIAYLRAARVGTLDITGGAPELNPHFRDLVRAARDLGVRVIDRCNLTILEEPGREDLAAFLAGHNVEVAASLPCYAAENVDRQRGNGVFAASIRALRRLNGLGYAQPESSLVLNLVFNPQGATLPPDQVALEADYRVRLREAWGVEFNQLYTLANMPIARFGSTLVSKGQFGGYMNLLRSSYRAGNLDGVMCRSLISVDWQGYVYDCDFNQMLGLPLQHDGKSRLRLTDLVDVDLSNNAIVVKDHCYGCTAGQGSSCGGALKS
ncbi:MAG: arsenosugar biosynthesis radical SAM protein ArsS [Pseudomonadota bacterium]|nr:arsenosugar biosynthesis radical SAM protein ArsS [Burkholderiales bacterium]MDQ3196249.1 arsenosugar biosynthesis radical SAM protein ArsS [Pseudomonadota bacterium]